MKRKIRDALVWFLFSCKRLLKRPSFALILIIIPIAAFAIGISVKDDSGVLRIGICNGKSHIGSEITDRLLNRDSVIHFTCYRTEAQARNDVIEGKIQAAWIFPDDLDQRIYNNAKMGLTDPLVKVIEREETTTLNLSHELLYGCLHRYVVYDIYETFAQRKYKKAIDVSTKELEYHYENALPQGDLITVHVVGEQEKAELSTDFLTFPLRGILSLLTVLCGIAAVMVFLSDRAYGRYAAMSASRHIIPAFGICFAGVLMSSVAMLASVFIIGRATDFISEFAALLLYIMCVCGFCLVCAMLFQKASVLGIFIPIIMIIMLIQCPVFFVDEEIRPLSFLFPPSYYLYAVYNKVYLGYMAVYSAVTLGLAYILNILSSRHTHKNQ